MAVRSSIRFTVTTSPALIEPCSVSSEQHFWLPTVKGMGVQHYSCPMCQQMVFWSYKNKTWTKTPRKGEL